MWSLLLDSFKTSFARKLSLGRRRASLPPTASHRHDKWRCHQGWPWWAGAPECPLRPSTALRMKTGLLSLAFEASTVQPSHPLDPHLQPRCTSTCSQSTPVVSLAVPLHTLFSLLGMLSPILPPGTNFYSSFKTQAQCLLICSAFADSLRQPSVLTPAFEEVSPHLTKEAWTHCLWPASRVTEPGTHR